MVPDPDASLVFQSCRPYSVIWGWIGAGCRVALVPIWNWGRPFDFAQGLASDPTVAAAGGSA